MGLNELAGNAPVKEIIRKAAEGLPANAYLITGRDGSGKKTAARLLASALVCTSAGDKPCLVCKNCVKAAANTHPDVITVRKEGKKNFLAGQARAIRNDAYIKPNEAECKIYILPDASDMEAHAQNAFLKVLEEPPPHAVFIFICRSGSDMLETVVSRCAAISMAKVAESEVLAFLRAKFPNENANALESAAKCGGGYIGAALGLLSGEDGTGAAASKAATAIAAGDELSLFEAFNAPSVVQGDALRRALAVLCAILRDAVCIKSGLSEKEAPAYADISARLAEKYSQARLLPVLRTAAGLYGRAEIFIPGGNFHAACGAALYMSLKDI